MARVNTTHWFSSTRPGPNFSSPRQSLPGCKWCFWWRKFSSALAGFAARGEGDFTRGSNAAVCVLSASGNKKFAREFVRVASVRTPNFAALANAQRILEPNLCTANFALLLPQTQVRQWARSTCLPNQWPLQVFFFFSQ